MLALAPADDRQTQHVFGDLAVDFEHALHFFCRLGLGRMRGVALLPQEFERAQERARRFLPPHHVRPLIDEDRQIAVRLHPAGVHHADDGFRRGPDSKPLGEFFAAPFGHPRDFWRESLDVFGFAHEQAFGDEQRKIRVLMARRFESCIELGADVLPDRVPVGTEDDAAAHRCVIHELCAQADLRIPIGDIGGLCRNAFDFFFLAVF